LETILGKDVEGVVINGRAMALQFVYGGGNLHVDWEKAKIAKNKIR
jgi:hypothetical protein